MFYFLRFIFSVIFLASISLTSLAETLYVTDRIVLGVHQTASLDSPLITSIPSGTAVTVITRAQDFVLVKLPDGTEGWISSEYLKKDKPAVIELDNALATNQKTQESNKLLTQQVQKLERQVQLLRDELSNAKTSIKELKQNKPSSSPATNEVNEEQTKALVEAEQQILELNEKISTLETQLLAVTQSTDQPDLSKQLATAQNENKNLAARIELALANLQGEHVPTPEELAAIRPSYPVWYWLLILVVLIGGVIVGIIWYDHRIRARHGGFRM